MHTLFKTVRGKDNRLINAPFREMTPSAMGERSRVLDIGCGTGIWLLDMAERYKETEFVGLDLNSMAPDTLLPNVDIKVRFDYESPWALGEGSWDLIHLQLGLGSVFDWPPLYRKIIKHLKPGVGWFESVEIDFTPRCDEHNEGVVEHGPLRDWYGYLHQAYQGVHRLIKMESEDIVERELRESGFVEISHTVHRLPLNPWPPEAEDRIQHRAGNWYNIAMCTGQQENGRWNGGFGFEAMALAPLTRVYKWDPRSAQDLIMGAMKQSSNTNLHVYNMLHIWTARAPYPNEPR